MNNNRRKRINRIIVKLENLDWLAEPALAVCEAIQTEIDDICDEEQECFDNLPEGLQYSERGEAIEEAAENLEEASNAMEELINLMQYIDPDNAEEDFDDSEIEDARDNVINYLEDARDV